MTKTTIFSIIGAVIIIAVATVLIITNKPKTTDQDNLANQETDQTTQSNDDMSSNAPSGKKMAFVDFVKQGGSYQCDVNQYIDSAYSATTKGKVYIAGGNIRGDYKTIVQGMNINSSMIVRDEMVYTWTSLSSTGYKSKVTADSTANTQAGASGNFSWNAEMVGDYDCTPWTTDASMFTIPASITFQELK